MEGRLILVHLMCKDMMDEQNPENNIFTTCVSFRVAGSPRKYYIVRKSAVNKTILK